MFLVESVFNRFNCPYILVEMAFNYSFNPMYGSRLFKAVLFSFFLCVTKKHM